MFKKFIERIIAAKDKQDAVDNVLYGTIFDNSGHIIQYGVDLAYQHEKISYKEHELLFALVEKMA